MNKHKYKRSRQRERILGILRGTKTHPTASWVYDELKKEFNNLSMGTVYRNIN
ncbi:MAG: transcriptional repressor, partial [Dethiobacteria bacterium]|nr:transcriptional repressor [Dethiobacteria bacterium]